MSDPSLYVMGAYKLRLKSQIGAVSGRVYDKAPQTVAFPYIEIGDIQTVGDGADCLDSTEIFVTLHVWSRASNARVECSTLNAACRTALHEWRPDLSAAGYRVVEHMHQDTRTLEDPDGVTAHGVLTFRALIDPV